MKKNTIQIIGYLVIVVFMAVSCNKDTAGEITTEAIKVSVTLGSSFVEGSDAIAMKSGSDVAPKLETQTRVIPMGNGIDLVAELVPEQEIASEVEFKAATNTPYDLAPGTKYRVLVYNSSGNEVKRIEKTAATGDSGFEVLLDAEGTTTTYTFVAYSAGTADLPTLPANSSLSTVVQFGSSYSKVMHWTSGPQSLTVGNHNMSIVMANKGIEVTTVLNGAGIGLNKIEEVGPVKFKNIKGQMDLTLGSGNVQTPGGSIGDKAIAFSPIATGVTDLTSVPVGFLDYTARAAGNGTITIDYIDIEGIGRSQPVSVAGLNFLPRYKYKLNLNLRKGKCMYDVNPQSFNLAKRQACKVNFLLGIFTWYNYSISQANCTGGIPLLLWWSWATPNNGEVIGNTAEYSPMNGSVINITALDNSFNIAVNDPNENQNTAANKIASKEIQFEGTGRNIRFTDGTRHGIEHPNIWEITNGTQDHPVIRVTISEGTGVVSIQGRKSNSDLTLYPMATFNSTNLQNVIWNATGSNNKVTITQTVQSATYVRGTISGKQLRNCN